MDRRASLPARQLHALCRIVTYRLQHAGLMVFALDSNTFNQPCRDRAPVRGPKRRLAGRRAELHSRRRTTQGHRPGIAAFVAEHGNRAKSR